MVTTLVPMFPTLERTSSQQTKNKSNPHPNRWANPHCMFHPYRELWPMQPQRRTRAGRSLLSSHLQRCWFGLQSRRLRADPQAAAVLESSSQKMSSLQPHLWGFDAPVLMDVKWLPGLFNSRAASGWTHSFTAFHGFACREDCCWLL